jgi:hypothetical protein
MQPTVLYDSPASVPMKNSLGANQFRFRFSSGSVQFRFRVLVHDLKWDFLSVEDQSEKGIVYRLPTKEQIAAAVNMPISNKVIGNT